MALQVALLVPLRASAEDRFFIEPTTETQPPAQPGFTALYTVGSPAGYLVEGLVGLGKRAEVGVDYVDTPSHLLLAVGRVRVLDETRSAPAFAVGVENATVSAFGKHPGPSPDEVYANASKTLGLVRIMAGAFRFAPGFGAANMTRADIGAIAALKLDFGHASHGRADSKNAPPAFDVVADYASGTTALGQIGLGIGYHPNEHLNIQPGIVIPSDCRSGPPRFQLQLHVN